MWREPLVHAFVNGISPSPVQQDGGGDAARGVAGLLMVAAQQIAVAGFAVHYAVLCAFTGFGVGNHLVPVQSSDGRTRNANREFYGSFGGSGLGAVVLPIQGTAPAEPDRDL